MNDIDKELGGPGSGHHGHAGREGKKGGSIPARLGQAATALKGPAKAFYEEGVKPLGRATPTIFFQGAQFAGVLAVAHLIKKGIGKVATIAGKQVAARGGWIGLAKALPPQAKVAVGAAALMGAGYLAYKKMKARADERALFEQATMLRQEREQKVMSLQKVKLSFLFDIKGDEVDDVEQAVGMVQLKGNDIIIYIKDMREGKEVEELEDIGLDYLELGVSLLKTEKETSLDIEPTKADLDAIEFAYKDILLQDDPPLKDDKDWFADDYYTGRWLGDEDITNLEDEFDFVAKPVIIKTPTLEDVEMKDKKEIKDEELKEAVKWWEELLRMEEKTPILIVDAETYRKIKKEEKE